jgi:hypothetical protein
MRPAFAVDVDLTGRWKELFWSYSIRSAEGLVKPDTWG